MRFSKKQKWQLVADKKMLVGLFGIFFGSIVGLHYFLLWLRNFFYFDMDQYWPISIFLPKIPQ